MQNKVFIAIAAIAIIGGAWWVLSNQEAAPQEPVQSPPPAGGNEAGEAVIVRATDSGYEPGSVTISAGTTVTFVNESSRPVWTASAVHPSHLVLPAFDVRRGVEPGDSYSFTFEQVGTWRYHDHLRPQNTGEVVVQ